PIAERTGDAGRNLALRIRETWSQIISVGDRLQCAFSIASAIHEADSANSKNYYSEGARLAASEMGLAALSGGALRPMVMLLARATAAAERGGGALEQDWDKLWRFANKLPGKGDGALALAFAALHVAKSKKDRALALVDRYVKPSLRAILADFQEA